MHELCDDDDTNEDGMHSLMLVLRYPRVVVYAISAVVTDDGVDDDDSSSNIS
jgi:hypothetical protein